MSSSANINRAFFDLRGWLAHRTECGKWNWNFMSISLLHRRRSAVGHLRPILGILHERSGAPEPLLAWNPDVVRRGRLAFRFCS